MNNAPSFRTLADLTRATGSRYGEVLLAYHTAINLRGKLSIEDTGELFGVAAALAADWDRFLDGEVTSMSLDIENDDTTRLAVLDDLSQHAVHFRQCEALIHAMAQIIRAGNADEIKAFDVLIGSTISMWENDAEVQADSLEEILRNEADQGRAELPARVLAKDESDDRVTTRMMSACLDMRAGVEGSQEILIALLVDAWHRGRARRQQSDSADLITPEALASFGDVLAGVEGAAESFQSALDRSILAAASRAGYVVMTKVVATGTPPADALTIPTPECLQGQAAGWRAR